MVLLWFVVCYLIDSLCDCEVVWLISGCALRWLVFGDCLPYRFAAIGYLIVYLFLLCLGVDWVWVALFCGL